MRVSPRTWVCGHFCCPRDRPWAGPRDPYGDARVCNWIYNILDSGELVEVPRHGAVVWSSFDCNDASIEGSNRGKHKKCITEVSHSTGITFHGTANFFSHPASLSKLGVSENVKGLLYNFGEGKPDGEASDDGSENEANVTVTGGRARMNPEPVPVSAPAWPSQAPAASDLAASPPSAWASPTLFPAGTLKHCDSTLSLSPSQHSLFGTETPVDREGEQEQGDERNYAPFQMYVIPPNLNDNMTAIYKTLSGAGCACAHFSLNNGDFLVPVSRNRLWFIYGHVKNLGLSWDEVVIRLENVKNTIFAIRDSIKDRGLQLPFESFVLPEDHRSITHLTWALRSKWNAKKDALDRVARSNVVGREASRSNTHTILNIVTTF